MRQVRNCQLLRGGLMSRRSISQRSNVARSTVRRSNVPRSNGGGQMSCPRGPFHWHRPAIL